MSLNAQLCQHNTRRTNHNDMGRVEHCYRPWQHLDYVSKSVVPSNSRPTVNICTNGVNNSSTWRVCNNDLTNNYAPGPSFISRRTPRASRSKCPIGGYKAGSYRSYGPFPIKHWRKQLIPRQGQPTTGKTSIGQLDRPGGINHLDKGHIYIHANQKSQCVINYIDTVNHVQTCKYTQRQRIRTNTSLREDYHTSTTSYLQSRVKLYDQRLTFDMTNTNPHQTEFDSLYNKFAYTSSYTVDASHCTVGAVEYLSQCLLDCSCVVKIIYNPSNTAFQQQGAVSSGSHARNRRVNVATNFQMNAMTISNRWGLDGVTTAKTMDNTYINSTCHNKDRRSTRNGFSSRQPAGGSGNHTVCFYTPSSAVTGILGSILQRTRGTGIGSLVCHNDCKLFKDACCNGGDP